MIFGLLIKYSSSVGEEPLAANTSVASALHQIVPSLSVEHQKGIFEILDTLQKMVIEKFNASAEAYFRYLSLDIHNNNVSMT